MTDWAHQSQFSDAQSVKSVESVAGSYNMNVMLAVALSILIGFFQVSETGTVIGLVKLPSGKPRPGARVVLVPPKYIELWNKEVQQRVDNYWEIYKPDLLANKDHVPQLYRLAYVEALRNLVTTMRHDLGDGASNYLKEASPTGQFEFRGIPFGTYQLLVQAKADTDNNDITWSRIVDVQSNVPIFVDLGKPAS